MIINDIAEVLIAPAKAFKRIIENPKYLAAVIVFLLFLVVAVGYESLEFSKIYSENTSPQINMLAQNTNATYWHAGPGVTLTNNYANYFNYSVYVSSFGVPANDSRGYYNLFGNYTRDIGPSSLQINGSNTNNVTAAISGAFSVSFNQTQFQNITTALRLVSPQEVPQSALLILYSNDNNYYTYDLAPLLSSTSDWQNLTITAGPNSHGWTSTGEGNWQSNITSAQLTFTYPTSSNITVNVGALFFRGQYLPTFSFDLLGRLFLTFALQFAFTWFILTAIMYLLFKGLKATDIVWKPMFIAIGVALVVMVIREIVNLVAAATLPVVYLPVDSTPGAIANALGVIYYPAEAISHLSPMAQTAVNTLNAATSTLNIVTLVTFVVSYVWLGALCSIIVGTIKPEFSMIKRIAISAISIVVTLVILYLVLAVPI